MIPAVILAGGQSRRLGGGDKCLLPLGGATILSAVISALQPQAGKLLINSNSDPLYFAHTGLNLRADVLPGRLGPLAGIHTAMLWAQEIGAEAVLTVPGDTPFLPSDLCTRLAAARAAGQAAIAASGAQIHPVAGIWPSALAPQLEAHLHSGGFRVRLWLEKISYVTVEFAVGGIDPFWNINTPDDLAFAQAAVAG